MTVLELRWGRGRKCQGWRSVCPSEHALIIEALAELLQCFSRHRNNRRFQDDVTMSNSLQLLSVPWYLMFGAVCTVWVGGGGRALHFPSQEVSNAFRVHFVHSHFTRLPVHTLTLFQYVWLYKSNITNNNISKFNVISATKPVYKSSIQFLPQHC